MLGSRDRNNYFPTQGLYSSTGIIDPIADLVQTDAHEIKRVYGPTLNPTSMLQKVIKNSRTRLSSPLRQPDGDSHGRPSLAPLTFPALKLHVEEPGCPTIAALPPESPTVHDNPSPENSQPSAQRFTRRPKAVKPFMCRFPGCNKSYSLAFEQVVHERTCKCGNFPTASKVHLGRLRLPQELCIKSNQSVPAARKHSLLPTLGQGR